MSVMRQQPQGAARVARGNPLGITDLWIGSSSVTLVKGYNAKKVGTNAASVIDGTGQAGRFIRGDGSTLNTGFSIAENANAILGSTDTTWFIVRRCRDTVARNIFIHYGYENGANSRCLLAPDGTSITWDYGNATNGSGRLQGPYSQDTLIETLVVVAGQIKGREIWRRGVKIASNTNAKASRTQDARPFGIGRPDGGAAMDNVETYMFGVSNREWSDAEIVAWSRDPWSVIESPRLRLAFPAPNGVSASVSWTESSDTVVANASAQVAASAAWSEAPESTALAVLTRVSLAASWLESTESSSAIVAALVSSSATWAESSEAKATQVSVGNDVAISAFWAEATEVSTTVIAARANTSASWIEQAESTEISATIGNGAAANIAWTEAGDVASISANIRSSVSANWIELAEGFSLRATIGEEDGIDALLVPPRQTVVFEGSLRIVSFEGGKRVVSFEGSKRMVEFQ